MPPRKTAPRKKAAPKSEKTSADAMVWVPRGAVRRDEIIRAGLLAVSGEIPLAAMNIKPEIVSASDVETDESGQEGRNYLVRINWTPRPKRAATVEEEDEVPGTLDKVLVHLQPLTHEVISETLDAGTDA